MSQFSTACLLFLTYSHNWRYGLQICSPSSTAYVEPHVKINLPGGLFNQEKKLKNQWKNQILISQHFLNNSARKFLKTFFAQIFRGQIFAVNFIHQGKNGRDEA